MTLVTVTLVDEQGILKVESPEQRKREESKILFEHLQAMLIFFQSVIDDMGTSTVADGQSSVRIALVDEEGIQEVESSKPRKSEESEILFECLQATLFSIEAIIDRVTVLSKASAKRLEGSQLS